MVTKNRNETRNARLVQCTLDMPYTMALRLLREGRVTVRDGVVVCDDAVPNSQEDGDR